MRVAFHAPMKPPDDPVASGDRTMARLLMAALAAAGHEVELAARFRSFDAEGDAMRQRRIAALGRRLAERLQQRWQRRPPAERPGLWMTYHLYHKAPDYLGPAVCDGLGIPYVVAEASCAGKRAAGGWAAGYADAAAAIRRADLVLGLNPADDEGIRPLLSDPGRLLPLPPFLDARAFAAAALTRSRHRRALAAGLGLDPAEPLLLAVAMMRPGDKLASFRLLGAALAMLIDRPWWLLVAGDGPAQEAVGAALAPLGPRVARLGVVAEEELPALYAACDLFVWPAIGEAWGMALLEAQASGLPVIAGDCGGVATVVAAGESGLLTAAGDPVAFAAAARALLDDPQRRESMARAACANITERHDLPAASRTLDAALRPLAAAAAAGRKA